MAKRAPKKKAPTRRKPAAAGEIVGPCPPKSARRDGRLRANGLKFTRETQVAIVARVLEGEHRELAAEACGITERTMQRWVAKGRDELAAHERALDKGEEPPPLGEYACFLMDVTEAEALALAQDAKTIRDASMGGDVSAAQWRLTKHRPKVFGDRSKVQVSFGEDSEVDIVGEFMRRLDDIAGRLGLEGEEGGSGGGD